MRTLKYSLAAVCFAAASVLSTAPAAAHGALAIGMPKDIAEGGVAIGLSINKSTREEAEKSAVELCKGFMDAPEETRALCRVYHAFDNSCAAFSLDPKAGTPGIGWYVAQDSQTAEANAIALCKASAGTDRQQYCEPSATRCDN